MTLALVRSCPTSPAACQVEPEDSSVPLEEQHVAPAHRAEVIGGRAADDAAADDHHARRSRQVAHASLSPKAAQAASNRARFSAV